MGATILVVACSSRLDRVTVGPPAAPAPPTSAASGAPPSTAGSSSTNIKGSITDTPSIHVSGPRRTQGYDGFVALVVADIQSFWTASYPTIAGGQAYRDLKGGLWPVGPRARDVPGCGEPRTDYREVQDNAFYCPDGDFIAFDDAALFPQLESRFGRYTVATVLAHEWGHAIQHRRTYSLSGVLTEALSAGNVPPERCNTDSQNRSRSFGTSRTSVARGRLPWFWASAWLSKGSSSTTGGETE